MATFLERVMAVSGANEDGGVIDPVLVYCLMTELSAGNRNAQYVRDQIPNLSAAQLTQLNALLATMPNQPAERAAWSTRFYAVMMLSRMALVDYDTDAKCSVLLGI